MHPFKKSTSSMSLKNKYIKLESLPQVHFWVRIEIKCISKTGSNNAWSILHY